VVTSILRIVSGASNAGASAGISASSPGREATVKVTRRGGETQLPGLLFPGGPGRAVTQIEECLAAVCATADVKAACIACTWLPDHVGDQTARETITGLASALGADLAWH
jgi:hypothetical protein